MFPITNVVLFERPIFVFYPPRTVPFLHKGRLQSFRARNSEHNAYEERSEEMSASLNCKVDLYSDV